MSEADGSAVPPPAANERPIKFTPERLQHIKNLVERGLSREQIAETIGVTLGSLQVTCSRLGISSKGLPMRQRTSIEGTDLLPKQKETKVVALGKLERKDG
jgi:hypothetical protein